MKRRQQLQLMQQQSIFFQNEIYTYQGKTMKSKELNNILNQYIEKYNITYIEDPFDSNDEEYWKKIKLEHKNIDIVEMIYLQHKINM